MAALSAEQLEVISWIEKLWITEGKFPKESQFSAKYPEFNLQDSMANAIFIKALMNRGIKYETTDDLTPAQVAAVATLMNFSDKRSRHAKLKDLGITPATWHGWTQDKRFLDFVHTVAANSFHNSVDQVQEGIVAAAAKGDVNAAKFFLELTGRYTPQSQNEQNIKVVLARVIESIQRHVKDASIIAAIGADFEAIIEGAPTPPVGRVLASVLPPGLNETAPEIETNKEVGFT